MLHCAQQRCVEMSSGRGSKMLSVLSAEFCGVFGLVNLQQTALIKLTTKHTAGLSLFSEERTAVQCDS